MRCPRAVSYTHLKVERYNKGFEAVQALTQDKIDAVVIDGEPAKEDVYKRQILQLMEKQYL